MALFSSFSFFSFAFLSRSSRRVFARSISRARRSRIEEEDFIDDDINNDVVEGFALLDDEEIKEKIAAKKPYREWLDENLVQLKDISAKTVSPSGVFNLKNISVLAPLSS